MEWMGVSQNMWEIIFHICRYFIIALILAYIAKVYVNRRNVVVDLHAITLKRRIEAYRDLNKQIAKIQNMIAPSLKLQAQYEELVDGFRFDLSDQGMEYSSLFHSGTDIGEFFDSLDGLIRKHRIFLDTAVEDKLLEFQLWYTEMRYLYNAFCNAEADPRWGLKNNVIERNKTLASQILGVILQHDINKFRHQLNRLLIRRVRKIRLGNVYDGWLWGVRKQLIRYCQQGMDRDPRPSSFCRWLYLHIIYPTYGRSHLIRLSASVCLVFINIHYGERLSSENRFNMDAKTFMSFAEPFRECLSEYLKD